MDAMPKDFFKKIGVAPRYAFGSIMLVTNAFIWYFCAFSILKVTIAELGLNYLDTCLVWTANFGGAAISALIGAALANKFNKRTSLLILWVILGILSSITLTLINFLGASNALIFSAFIGVSFGLGMPICLGYYSNFTAVENRARLGGIIIFVNSAGTFILLTLTMMVNDTLTRVLILAAWRGLSLPIFRLIKPGENIRKKRSPSYNFILKQKSFLLYFVPWIMFSLINSLSVPTQFKILNESLVDFLALIEYMLAGVFAIIGGFLSDFIGRKRVTISGFVLLGLGYAILGIYPENLFSWYFYTFVDGVAWGIFFAIFLITIWGDLAYDASSEKYYALGGLPYLLSNFLQITLGAYIAEIIPAYAIFSFTAFFLFLAVIPLMYAPETLPEKTIRDIELRGYIEKAQKVKEKYT
jgi:MFS family permease